MSFPLLGNENVGFAVQNFIKADRIPHAIMIEGDEGTGRHTLAHFIACAAVCEGEDRPCKSCKQCHLTDIASNPDIIVVLPEDNKKFITVNQTRALRQDAFIKPHAAQRKVFIIDTADRMNEQAQNALLKVLEEPPKNVIFILITYSKTAMLQTIQSRCSILSLGVPTKDIAFSVVKKRVNCEDSQIIEALERTHNNIGLAIKQLGKGSENVARRTAEEFLGGLFSLSELELLKILQAVSNDRNLADNFFMSLKVLISRDLKENYSLKERSKILNELYKKTDYYTGLLRKNINLTLLFSAMVCNIKLLIG